MAVSTATLGGTTLPHVEPEGFREECGYRGGDREMLSGAVQTDLISTTAKRTFELSWRELTESQVATVKTAFATVDDGAATLVTPLGATVSVTRDIGAMALDIQWIARRQVAKARVTMRLREV